MEENKKPDSESALGLGLYAIPTDALLSELQSRNDATVILLLKHTRNSTDGDEGEEVCDQSFSGGAYAGIGMCETMIDRLRKNAERD